MTNDLAAARALQMAAKSLTDFDGALKTALHGARLGQDQRIENMRPLLHTLLDDYLDQYAIASRLGEQKP